MARFPSWALAVPVLATALAAIWCRAGEGAVPPPAVATPSAAPADEMVQLPGGSFMMGCAPHDRQCRRSEQPRRRVVVKPFRLDVHEVTAAEYAGCVSADACKPPTIPERGDKEGYTSPRPERQHHPINGVDWSDANAYCRWRQKRLPTEAEFEFALRGDKTDAVYPWGDSDRPPAGYGNYADEAGARQFARWRSTWKDRWFTGYDDGFAYTAPVCSFPRNVYGLCDISGNVAEWTADAFEAVPEKSDRHPCPLKLRVVRGGSWGLFADGTRASARSDGPEGDSSDELGFRCAGD